MPPPGSSICRYKRRNEAIHEQRREEEEDGLPTAPARKVQKLP